MSGKARCTEKNGAASPRSAWVTFSTSMRIHGAKNQRSPIPTNETIIGSEGPPRSRLANTCPQICAPSYSSAARFAPWPAHNYGTGIACRSSLQIAS